MLNSDIYFSIHVEIKTNSYCFCWRFLYEGHFLEDLDIKLLASKYRKFHDGSV